MLSNFKYVIAFLLLSVSAQFYGNKVCAQDYDEIWPELDALYRINHKFRTMVTYSSTRKQSQNTDGSFAAYLDFFALPFLRRAKGREDSVRGYYQWLRVGYSYGRSASGAEDTFREHLIVLESNSRFHLPVQFLLTWKNRLDTRVFNGELTERYRPRLTLERDCKTEYMTFTPYLYGEYYFATKSPDRFRLCLGTEIWVSKLISFEVYYLKQWQEYAGGKNLNAVGIALKFNLESKKEKEQRRRERERDETIRGK